MGVKSSTGSLHSKPCPNLTIRIQGLGCRMSLGGGGGGVRKKGEGHIIIVFYKFLQFDEQHIIILFIFCTALFFFCIILFSINQQSLNGISLPSPKQKVSFKHEVCVLAFSKSSLEEGSAQIQTLLTCVMDGIKLPSKTSYIIDSPEALKECPRAKAYLVLVDCQSLNGDSSQGEGSVCGNDAADPSVNVGCQENSNLQLSLLQVLNSFAGEFKTMMMMIIIMIRIITYYYYVYRRLITFFCIGKNNHILLLCLLKDNHILLSKNNNLLFFCLHKIN